MAEERLSLILMPKIAPKRMESCARRCRPICSNESLLFFTRDGVVPVFTFTNPIIGKVVVLLLLSG
jgi:hypothetical protein